MDYVKENQFTKQKEIELLTARKDQVIKIAGLKKSDGTNYFSMKYVLDRYWGMNDQDRIANEEYKKRAEEKKKAEGGEGEGEKGEEFKL